MDLATSSPTLNLLSKLWILELQTQFSNSLTNAVYGYKPLERCIFYLFPFFFYMSKKKKNKKN